MNIESNYMKKLILSLLLIGTCSPLLGMEQLISPEESSFYKKLRHGCAATGIVGGLANLCYQAKNGNLTWKQIGLSAAAIGFGISSFSKKELGMKVSDDDPEIKERIEWALQGKNYSPPETAISYFKPYHVRTYANFDRVIAIPKQALRQLLTKASNNYYHHQQGMQFSRAEYDIKHDFLDNHVYPFWLYLWSWFNRHEVTSCRRPISIYLENASIGEKNIIDISKAFDLSSNLEQFCKQERDCLLNDKNKLNILYEQANRTNTGFPAILPPEMIESISEHLPGSTPSQLEQLGYSFEQSIQLLDNGIQSKDSSLLVNNFALVKIKDLTKFLSHISLQDLRENNFLLRGKTQSYPYYKTIIRDILLADNFFIALEYNIEQKLIFVSRDIFEKYNDVDPNYCYCPLNRYHLELNLHNPSQASDTDDFYIRQYLDKKVVRNRHNTKKLFDTTIKISGEVLCIKVRKDIIKAFANIGISRIKSPLTQYDFDRIWKNKVLNYLKAKYLS